MRRPRHATIVAYLALSISLGGTSYAAITITGKNVKDGSLSQKDLSKQARKALKGNRGAAGAPGATGPAGATGAAGATGPRGATGTVDTSAFYDKGASDARFAAKVRNVVPVGGAGTAAENGAALRAAYDDAPSGAVLVAGPGDFDLGDQALALRQTVALQGSGAALTRIFTAGADRTAMTGATTLRDLEVEVTGSGALTAIAAGDQRLVLERVALDVRGRSPVNAADTVRGVTGARSTRVHDSEIVLANAGGTTNGALAAAGVPALGEPGFRVRDSLVSLTNANGGSAIAVSSGGSPRIEGSMVNVRSQGPVQPLVALHVSAGTQARVVSTDLDAFGGSSGLRGAVADNATLRARSVKVSASDARNTGQIVFAASEIDGMMTETTSGSIVCPSSFMHTGDAPTPFGC